jgi:hypothetical protein
MVGTAYAEPQELTSVRPDLPIPLAPVIGPGDALARVVLGLQEPAFERARNVTLAWAAATGVALLARQTVVAPRYAPFMLGLALVFTGYVIFRTVALVAFERRQQEFEAQWLDEKSRHLRCHPFEVAWFSLESDAATPGRQTFDLADPADVAQLLQRQASERDALLHSRARIEFMYQPGDDESRAVASVRRELRGIEFYVVERQLGRAVIRFPEATYGSRPAADRGQRWPGRRTYWFLTGPVRLTAVAPDSARSSNGRRGAVG